MVRSLTKELSQFSSQRGNYGLAIYGATPNLLTKVGWTVSLATNGRYLSPVASEIVSATAGSFKASVVIEIILNIRILVY